MIHCPYCQGQTLQKGIDHPDYEPEHYIVCTDCGSSFTADDIRRLDKQQRNPTRPAALSTCEKTLAKATHCLKRQRWSKALDHLYKIVPRAEYQLQFLFLRSYCQAQRWQSNSHYAKRILALVVLRRNVEHLSKLYAKSSQALHANALASITADLEGLCAADYHNASAVLARPIGQKMAASQDLTIYYRRQVIQAFIRCLEAIMSDDGQVVYAEMVLRMCALCYKAPQISDKLQQHLLDKMTSFNARCNKRPGYVPLDKRTSLCPDLHAWGKPVQTLTSSNVWYYVAIAVLTVPDALIIYNWINKA